MKNTVKKILALVFVVAMVCSLAVPAFADNTGKIYVIGPDGAVATITGVEIKDGKANVLETLKAADNKSTAVKFTFKNNILTAVAKVDGETAQTITTTDAFETSTWMVAKNGKPITGDLAAVSIAKDDTVVVYWADATIGSKLAICDTSAIAQGIVSFHYYDAEGNKQPLVGAAVEIEGVNNKLAASTEIVAGTGVELVEDYNTFVTDEKGQIWIAPEYLDNKDGDKYTITSIKVKELHDLKLSDDYTEEERDFWSDYKHTAFVDVLVKGKTVTVKANMYDTAAATGDMTMVYVLVAAAAVVTLGAVVIMKKKAVKAN